MTLAPLSYLPFYPCPLVSCRSFGESLIKLFFLVPNHFPGCYLAPISYAWGWILSSWQSIQGCCVFSGNQELRMSSTSHFSLPWISTCLCSGCCCCTMKAGSCLFRKDTWNTLCTPFIDRSNVTWYADSDICWKIKKVPAISDPVSCLSVLSKCACCSARLSHSHLKAVFFWNHLWIAVTLTLGLLGGIQWAWIGPPQYASFKSGPPECIAWMMKSYCMWGCICNLPWIGTLWWMCDCCCCPQLCLFVVVFLSNYDSIDYSLTRADI